MLLLLLQSLELFPTKDREPIKTRARELACGSLSNNSLKAAGDRHCSGATSSAALRGIPKSDQGAVDEGSFAKELPAASPNMSESLRW